MLCWHSPAVGPAWPSEAREVGPGRVRILLERLLVLLDNLERRPEYPYETQDVDIFVRVHLDVEEERVPGQGRAGGLHTGLALRPDAGRMNVGEVDTPLLPPRRQQIR